MARLERLEVVHATLDQRAIPIFGSLDPVEAVKILDACAGAGARVVEFLDRGDRALAVFRTLITHVREQRPQLILGTGTVLDAPTAAIFIAEGAEFIVAPTLSREVSELCNLRGIAYLPGVFTATEAADAMALGCDLIKFFPQRAVDGPAWLRSLVGPFSSAHFIPTGSRSDPESIRAWFAAGAAAIGIGPDILTPDRLAAGDWETIRSAFAAALRQAQAAPGPSA
jgi:2-dehydro-3-deoxyphosphogluconate aldolase / (4S)-4-hydroxy-2-oxoglutarate aldolase